MTLGRALGLLVLLVVVAPRAGEPSPAAQPTLTQLSVQQPVMFEENVGQYEPEVRYVARQGPASLFLTDEGATLGLRDRALTMKVARGRAVRPIAKTELPTKTNYFLGDDPSAWHVNVASYGTVTYANVLDGVDLVFHGEGGQLEYDFVVAPGADPKSVELEVEGADGLTLTAAGDVAIHTPAGDVLQPPPRVFQRGLGGKELDVAAGYRLAGSNRIAFDVAPHDPTRALVIDPLIVYSQYLGGSAVESSPKIAVDPSGDVYVAGSTSSASFPGPAGSNAGSFDAFVVKLDATGARRWVTYLGGSAAETMTALRVDATGAYIAGTTTSSNFPVLSGSAVKGGTDAYAAKLDVNGAATYSTYIGGAGTESLADLLIDGSGNAYVAGTTTSADFPQTDGSAYAVGPDAYVAKLAPNGAPGGVFAFATYLGGAGTESLTNMVIDSSGSAYVLGATDSLDFPVTPGSAQPANGGGANLRDAFIVKLGANGARTYATYLGGSDIEVPKALAIDGSGNAYVAGMTSSSNFPATPGAVQSANGGLDDAFVAKLGASGALSYATYLGGGGSETVVAMVVDGTGNAHVTGESSTPGFPTTAGTIQGGHGGGVDAYVVKLAPNGTLVYGTYLGGTGNETASKLALDGSGNAYVAGTTASSNFPVTSGAAQPTWAGVLSGVQDAYLVKLGGTGAATYATYMGGTAFEFVNALLVDAGGNAYLEGHVTSSPSGIPQTPGALPKGNGNDAYLVKYTPTGARSFATHIGGSAPELGEGLALDGNGDVYVIGTTQSANFPQVAPEAQTAFGGSTDVFIAKLSNAPLALSPPTSQSVAPQQSLTFTANGGSPPYTLAITTNGSGATSSPIGTTGLAYVAGANAGTDVVKVTDSAGDSIAVGITVTNLTISPGIASVGPHGSIVFTGTGGNGGLVWSVAGGGTIAANGVYTAGSIPNVQDTVTLRDGLGNTVSVVVTVTSAIAITPPTATVGPDGAIDFSAIGGTGAITFTMTGGSGGSISTSGSYIAGASASTIDTIKATDSTGSFATATVNVTATLRATPPFASLPPGGSQVFTPIGGVSPYTFAFVANASGGSLSGGSYVAGRTPNVTDTIRLSDGAGSSVLLSVAVGAGLTVTPGSASVAPLGGAAFKATGGSGDYRWSLAKNASGGSIGSSGAYRAGATSGVDHVEVIDSLGNVATAVVSVGAALAIAPLDPSVAPGGAVAFTALGGAGGYSWTLGKSASGGSIDAATGAYVAGANGGGVDVVIVTDAVGATATASVHVAVQAPVTPGSPATPVTPVTPGSEPPKTIPPSPPTSSVTSSSSSSSSSGSSSSEDGGCNSTGGGTNDAGVFVLIAAALLARRTRKTKCEEPRRAR